MAFSRGVSDQDLFAALPADVWFMSRSGEDVNMSAPMAFSGLMNCQAVKTAFRASGRKKKNILLV